MSPPAAPDAAGKAKKSKRPGDEVAKQIAKTKKKLKGTEVREWRFRCDDGRLRFSLFSRPQQRREIIINHPPPPKNRKSSNTSAPSPRRPNQTPKALLLLRMSPSPTSLSPPRAAKSSTRTPRRSWTKSRQPSTPPRARCSAATASPSTSPPAQRETSSTCHNSTGSS